MYFDAFSCVVSIKRSIIRMYAVLTHIHIRVWDPIGSEAYYCGKC